MEKLNELIFLMPDYELEGYPRSLSEEHAAKLLSGWVALWHPLLICGCGKIPRWHQASRLPSDKSNRLFVLPPISLSALADHAAEEIHQAGGLLIEPGVDWREFQASLLQSFPALPTNDTACLLAAQFASLGYTFLQVQLMTRQLRYTSNLDMALFEEQVLKATEAVLADQSDRAGDLLQACFDTLGQERDHYYSNDGHLIDVTLLAKTTLGKSLQSQLSHDLPTNLIASASMLQLLKEKSVEQFELLKQRLGAGTIALAGGLERDCPMPLLPPAMVLRQFERGAQAYRSLGIEPPSVFAQMSFGLTSDSPSLLSRYGFRGAILMSFLGGSYPSTGQTKISWEAQDGARISALAGEPLDANSANSFLSFGWSLGEALDRQHVPTMVLAHWPSKVSQFYELLQIAAQKTPALGRFQVLDRYFTDTSTPYHHERLDSKGFSFNWLAETQAPSELLQRCKLDYQIQCRFDGLLNLSNLRFQLANMRSRSSWNKSDDGDLKPPVYRAVALRDFAPGLADLIDVWQDDNQATMSAGDGLAAGQLPQPRSAAAWKAEEQRLTTSTCRLADEYAQNLASNLLKQSGSTTPEAVNSKGASGRLLLNPRSNPLRVKVTTLPQQGFDCGQGWHFATGVADGYRESCIDLPSMGFVAASFEPPATSKAEKLSMADNSGILRSEFIEAQVDLKRGHLRSLHVPGKRGNRLSMMVALRTKSGSKVETSEMVARSVRAIKSSSMTGQVRSQGALLFQGKQVAEFELDYELARGSRILELTLRLSGLRGCEDNNPWLSAYVLRLAWPTESAILRSFPDGRRTVCGSGKIVASDLIEIDEVDYRTHYLTGGLAFHARQELRFLETVVAVQGQSEVEHKVGIGVDLPYPLPAAQQFSDVVYQTDITTPQKASCGWLVSVDSRSVQVNLVCPLQDDQQNLAGMRIAVAEQQGRSITAKIQFFRDVAEAHRVDFLGNHQSRVTAEGDSLTVALRAHEQTQIDLLWKV